MASVRSSLRLQSIVHKFTVQDTKSLDGNYKTVVQISETEGTLHCLLCDKMFCDHIVTILKQNSDAKWIWTDVQNGQSIVPAFGQNFCVPIVPTLDVYAIVQTGHQVPGGVKLHLLNVNNTDAFIGFTSEGEGRGVWRQMIVSYFTGWIAEQSSEGKKFECPSSGHNIPEQVKWEVDMKDKTSRFLQYWSILTNQLCLGCVASLNESAPDFSKLAPSQ